MTVQTQLTYSIDHRQPDGTHPGVEFCHARSLRNLLAQVVDEVLRDLEIALPESAWRVVHLSSTEALHHRRRSRAALEMRPEYAVRSIAVSIEP